LKSKIQESKLDKYKSEYSKNKSKFTKLFKFLKKYHNIVDKFHQQALLKLFSNDMLCKHKLYFLFLDCINAAGGNNLSATGESTKKFYQFLKDLPNEKKINYTVFLEKFVPKNRSLNGISHIRD